MPEQFHPKLGAIDRGAEDAGCTQRIGLNLGQSGAPIQQEHPLRYPRETLRHLLQGDDDLRPPDVDRRHQGIARRIVGGRVAQKLRRDIAGVLDQAPDLAQRGNAVANHMNMDHQTRFPPPPATRSFRITPP